MPFLMSEERYVKPPSGRITLYRALGDLISLHWEFHKWKYHSDDGKPKRAQDIYFEVPAPSLVKLKANSCSAIAADYVSHFRTTVQTSLLRSLSEFYFKKEVVHDADVLAADAHTRRLIEIIEDIREEGKTLDLAKSGRAGLEAGIRNAIGLTVHCVIGYSGRNIPGIQQALYGASKIGLHKLPDFKAMVGYTPEGIQHDSIATEAFDALGPKGVTKEQLQNFGHGKHLGCPATFVASPETKAFLTKFGVVPDENVVIGMTRVIEQTWVEKILPWYFALTGSQRNMYFHPATQNLIEGRVLEKK